jgi:hypothetical protein
MAKRRKDEKTRIFKFGYTRTHKSKKDKQYNDQKKRDKGKKIKNLQNTTHKTKYRTLRAL